MITSIFTTLCLQVENVALVIDPSSGLRVSHFIGYGDRTVLIVTCFSCAAHALRLEVLLFRRLLATVRIDLIAELNVETLVGGRPNVHETSDPP